MVKSKIACLIMGNAMVAGQWGEDERLSCLVQIDETMTIKDIIEMMSENEGRMPERLIDGKSWLAVFSSVDENDKKEIMLQAVFTDRGYDYVTAVPTSLKTKDQDVEETAQTIKTRI